MRELLLPGIAIFGVLAGLVLSLLLFDRLGRKWGWSTEIQRKAVHIAMGLATMTFPWIFNSPGPVWILCGLVVLLLSIIKLLPAARKNLGNALHGVERSSLGDIYFAIAVAILFQLAYLKPVFYIIPLLILTFADAAGAIIGVAYGKNLYQTIDGRKSTEGSILFFMVAFFCAQVPLTFFSTLGKEESLLVSLTLASLAMMLEGISTRGLDNLVLPLSAWWILERLSLHTVDDLLIRFAVFVALAILVIGLRKRSSLDGSSLMGAVLFGYTCVFVGGWPFLVSPLILYFCHLSHLYQVEVSARPAHNLYSLLAIAGTGLVFLLPVAWRDETKLEMLIPFAAGIAAHHAVLSYHVKRIFRPQGNAILAWGIAVLESSLSLVVLLLFFPLALVLKLWACHVGVATLILFLFSTIIAHGPETEKSRWRWTLQWFLATLAGLLAWWVARQLHGSTP